MHFSCNSVLCLTLALLQAGCTAMPPLGPPDSGMADASINDSGAPDAGKPDAGPAKFPRGLIDLRARDGVVLKTWVYAPAGPGPFPVFLVRNPYGSLNLDANLELYSQFFTSRGITLVWQATRGTGGSGGVFVPFLSEVDDAHDTIAWLVVQPACNGRIGVGGGSYLGYTAFAAAVDRHVVVLVSDDTSTDEEWTRHFGTVSAYLLSWWGYVERGRQANAAEQSLITNSLDLTNIDQALLGRDLPYWNGVLASGTSVYPRDASLRTLARSICVPSLQVIEGETDWNDPRLAWEATVADGCVRERDHQWLLVAPESHAVHFSAFGVSDTWVTPDMLTMLEAYLLQTRPAPTWAKVRYRVETTEATRTANRWPPPATLTTTFYLGPIGGNGEGTLTTTPPPVTTQWTMHSDPAATDPCQTPTATWFTSTVLTQDLVLVGAPRLTMVATTAAADFDVHVELYDYQYSPEVFRSLGTGSVRARYRTGTDQPLPASMGIPLDIELTTSARRVPAGHALTVSIAPSRCVYAENPHTGEPADRQTSWSTANIIFTLGAQGATLVLPQVP